MISIDDPIPPQRNPVQAFHLGGYFVLCRDPLQIEIGPITVVRIGDVIRVHEADTHWDAEIVDGIQTDSGTLVLALELCNRPH